MIVELGKQYKTRSKGNIEIDREEQRNTGRIMYMGHFLVSGRSNYWYSDGTDTDGMQEWDIVAELNGQPEVKKRQELPINVVLNIREVIRKHD